jgi:hypothetical protein
MDDVRAPASSHDGDVALTATRRPLGQVVADRRAVSFPPRPARLLARSFLGRRAVSEAGSSCSRFGPSPRGRVARPAARPRPTHLAPAGGRNREQGPADRASAEGRQGEHDEPGPARRCPGRSAVNGAMPSRRTVTAGSARIDDLVVAWRYGAGSRAGRAGPVDRGRGGGCRCRLRGGPRRRLRAGLGRRPACRRGRGDRWCGSLADRRWPDGARLGSRARCRRRVRRRRGRSDHLGRWARGRNRRGRRCRHRRARTRSGTGWPGPAS